MVIWYQKMVKLLSLLIGKSFLILLMVFNRNDSNMYLIITSMVYAYNIYNSKIKELQCVCIHIASGGLNI